jgi:hypothetical protein
MVHLGWRSVGYVETALRQLNGFDESDDLTAELTRVVSPRGLDSAPCAVRS